MVTNVIVLEGVDLAGKSTLTREIAERYRGVEILKQGPPDPHVSIMETYLRPLQRSLIEIRGDRPEILIMDRWHLGELIYGPLLRGKSRLTVQQSNYIEMVLQTFDATFMIVDELIDTLEERWDKRGDDLIKREWLHKIQMEYGSYTYTRPHWDNSLRYRADIVAHRLAAPIKLYSPLFGRYIGPRDPWVLLLGDRRSKNDFIFPFVPEQPTSGHWLMSAMRQADVKHMHVGIVNACELSVSELRELWKTLGNPPVITLGRNAASMWQEVNEPAAPARQLNHPQYERRFHYLKSEQYGEVIKVVMERG